MFDFFAQPTVKTLDEVRNFADLNAFVLMRGFQLGLNAVESNDLVYMEAVRADTVSLRDSLIEIMNNRYDYLTWYSFVMYLNRKSKIIALDASGDLAAAVDKFATYDGQKYYAEFVKPLFGTITESQIKVHYNTMLANIDKAIEEMRIALGR